MEQRRNFKINGEEIKPGEKKCVFLPMPKLYDCTPLSMPVHVFHGKKPGPVLSITSAIHGDEVNGVEISRKLIKRLSKVVISGTLIVVPIVNMYGFLYQDRYLLDRRDLNRAFPGSAKGSLAGRLARLLIDEVISKATHCIDLHTAAIHRSNLPQIRIDGDSAEDSLLAQAFNAPVVLHSKSIDGSLRKYAHDNHKQFILYEAGEALRFDDISIKTGVNGILGVLQFLGMVSKSRFKIKQFNTTVAKSSYWIRAPQSGIVLDEKPLGYHIKKGERLALIGSPTSIGEEALNSPISGIIIGKNNLPMVHEGAALFHISTFENTGGVADEIQVFHNEYVEKNWLYGENQ